MSSVEALYEAVNELMRCAPSRIKHPKLGACPSPSGRRWPEGPDEGQKTKSFVALPSPGASRHPLPEGEGRWQKRLSLLAIA